MRIFKNDKLTKPLSVVDQKIMYLENKFVLSWFPFCKLRQTFRRSSAKKFSFLSWRLLVQGHNTELDFEKVMIEPIISGYFLAGLSAMEQTNTGNDSFLIQVRRIAAKLLCCVWELGLQSSNCQKNWKHLGVLLIRFTWTKVNKKRWPVMLSSFHDFNQLGAMYIFASR